VPLRVAAGRAAIQPAQGRVSFVLAQSYGSYVLLDTVPMDAMSLVSREDRVGGRATTELVARAATSSRGTGRRPRVAR